MVVELSAGAVVSSEGLSRGRSSTLTSLSARFSSFWTDGFRALIRHWVLAEGLYSSRPLEPFHKAGHKKAAGKQEGERKRETEGRGGK